MASVAGVTNHGVRIAREVAEAVPVVWIRESDNKSHSEGIRVVA